MKQKCKYKQQDLTYWLANPFNVIEKVLDGITLSQQQNIDNKTQYFHKNS